MDDQWNRHSHTFKISQAQVVAIMAKDGSAFVERDLVLEMEDGRSLAYYSGDDEEGEGWSLDYHGVITVADCEPSERSTALEALIVVSGVHENGQRIEVRGGGWFGRDENGSLEITFNEPPRLLLPDYSDKNEEEGSEPEQKPKKPSATITPIGSGANRSRTPIDLKRIRPPAV